MLNSVIQYPRLTLWDSILLLVNCYACSQCTDAYTIVSKAVSGIFALGDYIVLILSV